MDELLTKSHLMEHKTSAKSMLKRHLLPLAAGITCALSWTLAPAAATTTAKAPKPVPMTKVVNSNNTKGSDTQKIDRSADKARLQDLSREMKIPLGDLEAATREARVIDTILKTMDRPWEAKPWYKYWPIFIIPKRINDGVAFWNQNEQTLNRAFKTYGVPPEIVLAIIGVETFYGKNMGSFRVLDALYTLGFHYPKRADYFSHEFANFVKLAKRENWNYNDIKGSYAGAMGMGQFMPWSYLTWAVDFNHNGHIDLFHEKEDAIGSVANYFVEHGWERDGHTVYKLNLTPAAQKIADSLLTDGLDLKRTVSELRKAGLKLPAYYKDNEPCRIIKLEEENGWTYYVGFGNFKAITGYNRSPLYAMTVYLLSRDLRTAFDNQKTGAKVKPLKGSKPAPNAMAPKNQAKPGAGTKGQKK